MTFNSLPGYKCAEWPISCGNAELNKTKTEAAFLLEGVYRMWEVGLIWYELFNAKIDRRDVYIYVET